MQVKKSSNPQIKEVIDGLEENRGRALTPRQRNFLEVLFGDEARGNVRTAMTLSGYSKKINLTEVTESLKEEIIELSKSFLALHVPQALYGKIDLLDNPTTPGANTKLKVIESILDRVGVTKKGDGPENGGININEQKIFILHGKEETPKIIEGVVVERSDSDEITSQG